MMNLRPNYYEMKDWIILDTKVIHMYNDEETPVTALQVKIGMLDVEEININNTYTKRSFSIIRWITKNEFDRLMHGQGIIIW